MMNELQLRKDIIAGFKLIIPTWCKECQKHKYACENCLKFKAASAGHLMTLKTWKAKKDEKRA